MNPIESLWATLARKICDKEKSPIINILQLTIKHRIEFTSTDISNWTLNTVIDSVFINYQVLTNFSKFLSPFLEIVDITKYTNHEKLIRCSHYNTSKNTTTRFYND